MPEQRPPPGSRRLAILLPDLRPGGAEWLHLHLARDWIGRGFAVDFVLLQARGDLLQRLPPAARVVDLAARRVRGAIAPLARYLRRSPPDVLLAAMWPLTVVAPVAARLSGFRGPVVCSEHSTLSNAYAGRGRLHRIVMRASLRAGHALADARIAVSAGVAEDLAALTGLERSRFTVIHNAATLGTTGPAPVPPVLRDARRPVILSVGTLKRQKRHDVLIDAFAQLHPSARGTLCIVGEGPDRQALEARVARHGLGGCVLLPGHAADPRPWYAHADLFVLSSDWEGFGNVLVEAMEQGIPVVSTDCPAGPAEILQGGRLGTLVAPGDPGALATAMAAALARPVDREALRRRARDFAVHAVAGQYLDVLAPGWREAA